MTTTSAGARPEQLLDLQGLLAGIRWRRRIWLSLGVLGLLAGALLAVLVPPAPTAVARVLVEYDEAAAGTEAMETSVALLETTQVATAALERLRSDVPVEDFLQAYEGDALTGNVLELGVQGGTDRQAVARAEALAEAFIADHVRRAETTANAEARALLDRRDEAEAELSDVDAGIAAATPGSAELDELYARRADLTAQIREFGQRAQETAIGAPRVAAGTQIVGHPRAVTDSPLVTGASNALLGLVLGLGAGLALAAVASVVSDRPVLRRDVATHVGASVIAQLPARRRGPARVWRRSRGVAERARVAATLVRAIRNSPGAVSLLELGCPRTAAAMALDIAEQLAVDRAVVVVDDLPGRELHKLGRQVDSPIRIRDGAKIPAGRPPSVSRRELHLGVGSVGPGTAWTDLGRLGSETVLIVRAGHADTAWLHTVARQLADAGVSVIGVVLVHPDPRDRSDGTLWDGLHHALRGRPAHPDRGAVTSVMPSRADHAVPVTAAASNGTAVAPGRGSGAALVVPTRRFDRGEARSSTERRPVDESPAAGPTAPRSTEEPESTEDS